MESFPGRVDVFSSQEDGITNLAKRHRAPKLSALRNQSTFSKTVAAYERPSVSRQMSHQVG